MSVCLCNVTWSGEIGAPPPCPVHAGTGLGLRELVGKECICVFNLPTNDWPFPGWPAQVWVYDVDASMVKMGPRYDNTRYSLWVSTAMISWIRLA